MRSTVLIVLAMLATQIPAVTSVELWSENLIWMDVEWIARDGDRLTVTATRRVSVERSTQLDVAPSASNFIRFRYSGASPHTIRADAIARRGRFEVPPVLPGGELLLLLQPSVIRPLFIEVSGPRVLQLPIGNENYLAIQGLSIGTYKATPVYATGFRGDTRTYTIRTGETTDGIVEPDAVGGLTLSAPGEICENAVEFGVATTLSQADIRQPIFRTAVPSCSVDLMGLPTGRLQVFYRLRSGALRTQTLNLIPQTIAKVRLLPFRVTVAGRVTLNGKPVAAAHLTFAMRQRLGPIAPSASAVTDGAGCYSIGLDQPGEHSIQLQSGPGVQSLKTGTFTEGLNQLDWALKGGTVQVLLERWDKRVDAEVVLVGHDITRSARWVGPVAFEALPFGKYELRVHLAGRLRKTLTREIAVDATTPEAKVVVDVEGRLSDQANRV